MPKKDKIIEKRTYKIDKKKDIKESVAQITQEMEQARLDGDTLAFKRLKIVLKRLKSLT
jgi:hypothetical protein